MELTDPSRESREKRPLWPQNVVSPGVEEDLVFWPFPSTLLGAVESLKPLGRGRHSLPLSLAGRRGMPQPSLKVRAKGVLSIRYVLMSASKCLEWSGETRV